MNGLLATASMSQAHAAAFHLHVFGLAVEAESVKVGERCLKFILSADQVIQEFSGAAATISSFSRLLGTETEDASTSTSRFQSAAQFWMDEFLLVATADGQQSLRSSWRVLVGSNRMWHPPMHSSFVARRRFRRPRVFVAPRGLGSTVGGRGKCFPRQSRLYTLIVVSAVDSEKELGGDLTWELPLLSRLHRSLRQTSSK